jgi:hypothetical protein
MSVFRSRFVTGSKAMELIREEGLLPWRGLWHYSFDLERFHKRLGALYVGRRCRYLYGEKPLNQWSPRPLYCSPGWEETCRDVVQDEANPYWYLRLTTFEEFLDRRSAVSRKPKKHFPSKHTYSKHDRKYKARFRVLDLEDSEFVDAYDRLRRPDHLDGQGVCETLVSSSPGLPRDWMKVASLEIDGRTVAVSLLVDDGRSCSMVNLASELGPGSLGVYLAAKTVEHLCARGYESFDSGVSGAYGYYKKKIFLDTVSVSIPDVLPIGVRLRLRLGLSVCRWRLKAG